MRILSIGAGAIGTYVGGSLALHGHDLVFVERPQVVDDLKSRGLRIEKRQSKDGHGEDGLVYQLDPAQMELVSSLEEALNIGTYDICIYALKSFDTPVFISNVKSTISNFRSLPAFLCLSNGIDNEYLLADTFGADKVIAGTVTSAIGRQGAGDVKLERLRGVGVAATHPISERLTAAMNDAGLNAQLFDRAADMKWSKMLTNLIANASSAILDMAPGAIFADPGLYRLEILQLREALAVMQAKGIDVVDLPGTPVRLLAFAVKRLPLVVSRPFLAKAVGGGRGDKMPSFHIDLHSGRAQNEVDYLNGAVVRAGKETGIPTPVNKVLTETLLKLTSGEFKQREFVGRPDYLINHIPD